MQRDAREMHKLDVELLSKRRAQERERQAKLQHHMFSISDDPQSNNVVTRPPSFTSKSQSESFETQSSSDEKSSITIKITDKRDDVLPSSSSLTIIEVPAIHPSSEATTPTTTGGGLQAIIQVDDITFFLCYIMYFI